MKILYTILVISLAAIVVAVGATWWRLRWHLRRPHHTPLNAPEQAASKHPSEIAEHAASTDHTN